MMLEEKFNNFGYLIPNEPCIVCGEKPAHQEPRFLYCVCINHFKLSPLKISDIKDKKENENNL